MAATYKCPMCGSADLRAEVISVYAIEIDNSGQWLKCVSATPDINDIQDDARMVCNNEDCEHEGPARLWLGRAER